MSALKATVILFAVLLVISAQPGRGPPSGGRGGPYGSDPNSPGGALNLNNDCPNDRALLNRAFGDTGVNQVNVQAVQANAAAIAKIKILIRILKILRKLGLPKWVKDLLKRLPICLLRKLLRELLKPGVIERLKNLYDLLKLLKELGIPLPFPFIFVPPCGFGQNVLPSGAAAPENQQCGRWL